MLFVYDLNHSGAPRHSDLALQSPRMPHLGTLCRSKESLPDRPS